MSNHNPFSATGGSFDQLFPKNSSKKILFLNFDPANDPFVGINRQFWSLTPDLYFIYLLKSVEIFEKFDREAFQKNFWKKNVVISLISLMELFKRFLIFSFFDFSTTPNLHFSPKIPQVGLKMTLRMLSNNLWRKKFSTVFGFGWSFET